jgi:membrane-bound lytic murein transglycosylase D
MNRIRLCISFCLLLLAADGFAQRDTIFRDDPVAAMLDSLARNKFISRIPKQQTQRNNKYKFAADSVPRYDALVYESRLAKLNAQSPCDLVYNQQVQGYIDLYVLRKRVLVERMLGLSQLYYPMFEEQLDKHNLPLELKHLAVIESALNPTATSRSGARGLWQFMYTTGKMFNLNVNSYVDERCDPYKSTQAACEYLKFLYGMFGDWQLVLAAYNAGPGTINKAIRRAGGGKKTYWEIRPYLPVETQGYVPAFIAANYVMNYHLEHNLYAIAPRKTFFDVDTVTVTQQVSFSQFEAVLGVPLDEMQFLNPMYKLGVIPVSMTEHYQVVLPANKVGAFVSNEQAIYSYLKIDTAMTALAVQQVMKVHTVRSGEHINSIAKKYKCTVADIRSWNNLKSNYLKPGQKLTIYTPQKAPAPAAQPSLANNTQPAQGGAANNPKADNTNTQTASNSATKYKYYTIRKGDTLWGISQTTGKSVEELKRLNGFGKSYKLMPGQKIKVGTL